MYEMARKRIPNLPHKSIAEDAGCRRSNISRLASGFLACLILFFFGRFSTAAVSQAEAEAYFRRNCMSCHTIGGGSLTGPDLKNVADRKEREWLARFIRNPKAVIESGDPYARQLFEDARGVMMPTLPGLNADMAEALLDLIAEESKLEESQFVGLQISDQPFTSGQITMGKDLYLGTALLTNQGAACVSCHAVAGLPMLGGGTLGPDLTRAYQRLGGRRALSTWLLAPATPSMQAVFGPRPLTQAEIIPLVAFLEDASSKGGEADPAAASLTFFLFGLGGAALVLVLFDTVWRNRFRAVRRFLLEQSSRRHSA